MTPTPTITLNLSYNRLCILEEILFSDPRIQDDPQRPTTQHLGNYIYWKRQIRAHEYRSRNRTIPDTATYTITLDAYEFRCLHNATARYIDTVEGKGDTPAQRLLERLDTLAHRFNCDPTSDTYENI